MPDYKQKLAGLIEQLIAQGASDLHMSFGVQPIIRVSGTLTPFLSEKVLTKEDLAGFIEVLLSPEHKKRFLTTQEIDFSYAFQNRVRFRGNAYVERGNIAIALRLIPRVIR